LILARAAPSPAQTASLTSGDVVLHYWPTHERLARALLPPVQALRFAGLPPGVLQLGTPVHVYLAPDPARWDSLTGGHAPEWGAGIALPHASTIVIPGFVSARTDTHDLPQILRHELTHIALHRFTGSTHVPRWFDEGYAMWSAGQFDADAGWNLRLAFVTRRAPPLDSISLDWPSLATDARLAYLLSATAVRYLYTLGSPATFQRFLAAVRQHASFEQALRDVYVLSSSQFERQWRQHVKRQFGWLQLIGQTTFIWLVLTLAVVVLFAIRRRRDRRKLAMLRESELPDEPAYWKVQDAPDQESPRASFGDGDGDGGGDGDAQQRGLTGSDGVP
jgi:hypothetical protein